jgi:hypothetical protein
LLLLAQTVQNFKVAGSVATFSSTKGGWSEMMSMFCIDESFTGVTSGSGSEGGGGGGGGGLFRRRGSVEAMAMIERLRRRRLECFPNSTYLPSLY